MSGGRFDYIQHRLNDVVEDMESTLKRQGKLKPKEELFCRDDYYEKYPEDKYHYKYPVECQQKIIEAIEAVRIATIYIQRVDWYLSDDDGNDSFIERLQEDLDANSKLTPIKIVP